MESLRQRMVCMVLLAIGGAARVWSESVVVHQSTGTTTTWCVSSPGASDSDLQIGLDWSCNSVDCSAIQAGGSCFTPDTVRDHASYAFNQYYQKASQTPGACSFNGAAVVTSTDPSSAGCTYASSALPLSIISPNGTMTSAGPASGPTTTSSLATPAFVVSCWHMCIHIIMLLLFVLTQ